MAQRKLEEWLKPDKLLLLQGWARDGLTYEQIAHNMGIDSATLRKWRKANNPIDTALQKGKEVCYFEVENALYKSAIGYEAIEREQIEVYDANGDLISTTKRKRSRHIPPNTGAICFILKNQKPEKWQDKPERIQNDTVADDGFIEALKGSAAEDWQDDDAADEELESGDLLNEKE